MKFEYFKIINDSVKILFPKFLTRESFETILNQVYTKSLSKSKYSKVIFSFQSLEWADIFEISLISLWIYKIHSIKKEIQVQYPLNPITYNFLQRYNFIDFLEKISSKKNSEASTSPKTRNNIVFYPLVFLTNEEFDDLLDDLNYKDRLQQVFSEISAVDIVKTGKIRDIIFAELGENMFLHGEGKNASLSAIAYKPTTREIAQNRIKLVSSFEKNFFRILGNNPYIEVTISDNGKGIYKKLISTYRSDLKYPKHKGNPTHAEVMEYAFLPYTSSRDLKERLNFIEKALTDNTVNDPPVTGLNKLKLVVKEFRGLILVKSGKGIICYDYLSNGELVFPETNDERRHKKFKNLVSFNGVQYKILIPLYKPKKITPIQTKFQFNEVQNQIKYEYKRLDNFFTPDCKYKLETARNQYYLFEQEIEHFHITNNNQSLILIFDFCESGIVNQKMLHLILIKLIESQTTTQLNSFINLPSEYIELFDSNYEYNKPIIGFDNLYNRIILGVSQADKAFFKYLLGENQADKTKLNYFINKFPFLFDSQSNSFIHNRAQILSFASISIRETIKSIILNPVSKVFHADVKVLIPTYLYCMGYFEIGNLFNNTYNRALIRQWLGLGFNSLKPNLIVSLTKHCGEIISEIVTDYKHKLESIVLETPIKEIDFLQLLFKIDKNSRIIIFTDVISSSKTVSRLLHSLSTYNVIHIVTVVNATTRKSFDNYGKNIPLSQALHYPITYHESLPPDWLYSELLLTDPKTNFLIAQDEFRPLGSLLEKYSIKREIIEGQEVLKNGFLEEIIVPDSLFEAGHFITNDKHFSYLFNIKSLVIKYESLIVNSIISHYKTDSKKRKIKPDIDKTILYFTYNPGIYQLCNSLSKRLPRSKIIDIDLSKKKAPVINNFKNENVFIIDDAFISGDSIIRLIDYCENRGAKNIFVYILIKRGTVFSARKLENIKKYGHSNVSVRYLFDSELPNYNSHECPICKEEQLIDRMESYIGSEHRKFWSYIKKYHGYKYKRIVTADFSFSNINNNDTSILYRWKIETSKYELVSQKEIISYLRNYEEDIEKVKVMFSIYSLEKECLLKEDLYLTDFFWIELKENLLSAGLSIIKSNYLTEINFLTNILNVAFWLDIETVANNFSSIISTVFSSEQRIFEFLYIIDKNKIKCASNLNSFASLIKNYMDADNSFDDEVCFTIEKFTDIWLTHFEESISNSNSQIEAIRKLYFESYHEFPRTFDALKASLSSTKTNKTEIISHWWNIKDIIQKSIRNLKLLLETGLSRNQIELLYNRINELNNLTYKVENLIDTDTLPKDLLLIDKISDSIVGENGIQFLLKTYRVDLKETIDYLNGKYSNQFDDAGLAMLSDIPEHPCLVFGEITNILSSIENLYENVLKHSGASIFIINISKSEDDQYIIIDIFDNGNAPNIEKGVGLSNVNRNVKKYLGNFSIINNFDDSEFKTNASIKLINLSK